MEKTAQEGAECVMKMQKNQPIGFPCGSIALLVGVVNAAIYLIYSTSVHHFSPLVFAALVAPRSDGFRVAKSARA